MATIPVANSTSYVNQFKKSKTNKNEIAYGNIALGSYTLGDTLQFTGLDAKVIPYAKFVTTGGQTLEIFSKTNLTNALTWATTTKQDIAYVIHYITGGDVDLKITVTAS